MTTVHATDPLATGEAPSIVTILDDEPSWLGIEPYREEHQYFFWGRDRDIDRLYRLVRGNRLTLLFGKSGSGKTSLLRAGLFPRERTERGLPVYVRLDYTRDPPELGKQVKVAIAQAARDAGMEYSEPEEGESLWEYLHRDGGEFWTEDYQIALPIIVLDQFEEMFTIGWHRCPTDCVRFVEELSDLVEERIPARLRGELADNPEVSARYALNRHHYKFLVSLREAFRTHLHRDEIREHLPPALFNNEWRLRPFSTREAKKIIERSEAFARVSDAIVDRVADKRPRRENVVEPAVLSVFCRELNDRRLAAAGSEENSDGAVTAEMIDGLFGDDVLRDFYDKKLEGLSRLSTDPPSWMPERLAALWPLWRGLVPRKSPRKVHEYIETSLLTTIDPIEDKTADPSQWIGREEVDARVSVTLAEAQIGLGQPVVEELVRRRLLRVDDRDAAKPRIELSHDVLIEPVRQSGHRRRTLLLRWLPWFALLVCLLAVVAAGAVAFATVKSATSEQAVETAELLSIYDEMLTALNVAGQNIELSRAYRISDDLSNAEVWVDSARTTLNGLAARCPDGWADTARMAPPVERVVALACGSRESLARLTELADSLITLRQAIEEGPAIAQVSAAWLTAEVAYNAKRDTVESIIEAFRQSGAN